MARLSHTVGNTVELLSAQTREGNSFGCINESSGDRPDPSGRLRRITQQYACVTYRCYQ